ncbi:MAG: glycosyltransferase [Actinobacteria bacterium]|nr:glycosyltransferase [Actinomycetota bacterium]
MVINDKSGSKTEKMNVAVVGNHVPRQCGLATFTADVAHWLGNGLGRDSDVFVVAMNDREEGYDYPPVVKLELQASDPKDYPKAADFVNLSGVDLVCLQHEFGIFGGLFGAYITDFLRDLTKPVITTAHTVLPEPKPERREVLSQIAAYSDAIIVMSRKCIDFLEEYYGVPRSKVHLIHHGVPDMPFVDPDEYKAKCGLLGKKVILTFGLLHPRKGIEYVIEAMPQVCSRFPDAVYVVLGATHPPYKRREGEKYRFALQARARELGVEDNVLFYDRFVTLEELTEFLACCDIYVTPYLDRNQVASGTLAYALGLGKPVISTPYYYAEELLSEGKGMLVDFCDPEGVSSCVLELFENPDRLARMRQDAYSFGRKMIWKEVSKEYVKLFSKVLAGRKPESVTEVLHKQAITLRDLPTPRLDYLLRLTDQTGILNKAYFDIPDRAGGYTTDDNALALAAAVLSHLQTGDRAGLEAARTYLSFLRYMQLPGGLFHQKLNYDKSYGDETGDEDCQGKALSGLGITVALEADRGLLSFAKSIFDDAMQGSNFEHPRGIAYAICGCYHYLTRFKGAHNASSFMVEMAEKLSEAYRRESTSGWNWYEDYLSYANGVLPRAMLLSYMATRDEKYREIALESLEFLTKVSYDGEIFDLVGDQGWYPRDGEKATYKQLPIEAASLATVYVDAYVVERDERYLSLARSAFEWFLGKNLINKPLFDFASFSCSDGLLRHEVEPNRGAEATIHWLLALLRIQTVLHIERIETGREPLVYV